MPYSDDSSYLQRSQRPLPVGVPQTESDGKRILKDPPACEWDQWRPIRDLDDSPQIGVPSFARTS
jgi:hypothetical protein